MTGPTPAGEKVTGPKAQVAAILTLHSKRTTPIDGYPADHGFCVEDRQSWPCATVQAIEAATCSTCGGDEWITVPVMQCGGEEHECGEGCAVPEQVPCPSCIERHPARAMSEEEPF